MKVINKYIQNILGTLLGALSYLVARFRFHFSPNSPPDEVPPTSTRKSLPKIISVLVQIVIGIFLGVSPYLIAWLTYDYKYHSAEAVVGRTIVFVISIIPTIITCFISHGLMTVFFIYRNRVMIIVGIWLIYPIFFISVLGNSLHTKYREGVAAREDYSSRELKRPNGEIRDLLLIVSDGISDSSGFYQGDACLEPCISLLRADVLESVAMPREERDGGFKVFRYARGDACAEAERSSEHHRELERMRENIAHQIVRLEREVARSIRSAERVVENVDKLPYVTESRRNLETAQDSAQQTEIQYRNSLESPRAISNYHGSPTKFGHLDECITTSDHQSFDYDIRIEYGDHLSRPYGPRWGIAEIYGVADGAPFLIARFEAGNGRQYRGKPISIADIVANLTGRPFDPDIAPYPVDDVESELARLAALIEDGAYVGNWFDLTYWINSVFQRARGGSKNVRLSADDIANLILIKQAGSEEIQERFIGEIDGFLTQQSVDALISADAAGDISARPATDR